MNILYLTSHLNIGGVTSYVFSLAKEMKKRGHNVYLASGAGQMLGVFLEEGISHIAIPVKTKQELSPGVFISLFKLLPFLKEKKIEVIHANTRVTQVLAALLNRFSGIKYISTCHGFFKKRLSRAVFPCWGLKVIAISEAVAGHLAQDFKVSQEKIKLIHNGIDVDKFAVQSLESRVKRKKELGLGNGPVIGIIGRLSDVKGHSYLIQAMKAVLEKIGDAQLLIVGDGKMKKCLFDLSCRIGVDKNTRFMPSAADTAAAFEAIDIFAMPSLKEGLGLSLMEAMACGLAVVASDVGGIKSLVSHGHSGLLVPPADPKALSAAILELLGDREKAAFLGSQARIFIRGHFKQEKMAQDTEMLYYDCHGL